MIRLTVLVSAITLASATAGAADDVVVTATDYADFGHKFCAVARDSERIFVLPAGIFVEQKSVTCSDGESMLRVSEPEEDPGHKVFNIDPPHGSKSGLDCDGKADIGMKIVAINCIPASSETSDHKKS